MYQVVFLLLLCVAVSLIISMIALIYLFLINKEITNIAKKISLLAPKEGIGEIVIKTSNKALEELMNGINVFIEKQYRINHPDKVAEQQIGDQAHNDEAGIPLKFGAVNLSRKITQTLASYCQVFEDSKITSDINVPYKEFMIDTDEGTLEIILKNLMGNILKYSEGNFQLDLIEEGANIILEIKNYAPSIKDENMQDILDGTYTKARNDKGDYVKGQGLKVTMDLVEMLEGSMEAGIISEHLIIKLCWLKHKVHKNYE